MARKEKKNNSLSRKGKRPEEDAAPTVQILWSRQVDDAMHHFPCIFAELVQVLTERLIMEPLLEKIKVKLKSD